MTLMPEVRNQLQTLVAERRRPWRRRLAGLGVALALAGGSGVAVSSTGVLSGASPEPERPTTGPPSPAAAAAFTILTNPELKARGAQKIAQLNRESRAPNVGPARNARRRAVRQGDLIVKDIGATKNGIALARTTGSTDVLIAAGSGGICLVTTGRLGAGASCSSERDTANGRNVSASGCLQQDDLLVAGVVPDDIRHVTITARSGTKVQTDVVNNALAYRVRKTTLPGDVPATISWTKDGSTITAPSNIPGDGRC